MPTVTLIRYGVLLPDGTLEPEDASFSECPLLFSTREHAEGWVLSSEGERSVAVTLTYESEPSDADR